MRVLLKTFPLALRFTAGTPVSNLLRVIPTVLGFGIAASLISPATAASRQQLAATCEGRGNADPSRALAACTALIESGRETRENTAIELYNRGIAYVALGQQDRALADYSGAIQLKPDYADAFNNRGSVYEALGQYARALEDYNEAIRLKPDDAFALNNRGIAYVALGQQDRALADYNEAIRLKPDNALAFNNRGIAYKKLGQLEHALADYSEAIRLKPDDREAFNNRGTAYADIGQLDHAIEDYNEAIRLKPDNVEVFSNRGYTYYELGQYNRALTDLNEAIRLKPDYALAFANRALTRDKLGDAAGAKVDRDRAAELQKSSPPANASSNPSAGNGPLPDRLPPVANAGCGPVAGDWRWFTGGLVTVSGDGALNWRVKQDTLPFPAGKWRCDNGSFVFTWNNGFVDTLQLTDGDKTLRGRNMQGVAVTGFKL